MSAIAPLRPKSLLVLGGARSGKSAYAQHLAERSGLKPIYLATAGVWDAEMHARVDAHRKGRDGRWATVEEAVAITACLGQHSTAGSVVVVDCLTLWLTNLMLGGHDVAKATEELASRVPEFGGPVAFVSNEVGAGIVPDNALARDFRDRQGRLNQVMASACDVVILVVAGLPVILKPSAQPDVRF